jgi:hypothetical protein
MNLTDVLRRDPIAALETAKAALAAEQSAIVELERQRPELLPDADLEEVKKLDRRIVDRQAAATVLAERIAALETRAQQYRADQREQQRRKAVDDVLAPAVAELVKDAAELEAALLTAVDKYRAIFDRRAGIVRQMPLGVPRPPYNNLALGYLSRSLFEHFQNWNGASFVSRLSSRAKQVRTSVEREAEEFLTACRTVPLPGEHCDDQEAA